MCLGHMSSYFLSQAQGFIDSVGGAKSLYGLKEETLDSLILTLLPPIGHEFQPMVDPGTIDEKQHILVLMLQEILMSLRYSAGFSIPTVRRMPFV